MAKKRRIIEIEWEDSACYSSGAWQDKKRRLGVAMIKSVGYVHHESKRRIELSPHVSRWNTCGNMVIPKSAIRKMRELEA